MTRTEVSGVAINVAERAARWTAIAGTIAFGVLAVSGPLSKYPNWAKHMAAVIAYLVLVATVLIVACLRSWRMGLSMDNHGVTIRNYFRTYRAGWGEVSRFADGAVNTGADGRRWALRVILQDGRAITACGTWKYGPPRNETLSAVQQGAGRYGVPADMHGIPDGRGGRLTAIAALLLVAYAIWTGAHLDN
jgi:hypothetical protein